MDAWDVGDRRAQVPYAYGMPPFPKGVRFVPTDEELIVHYLSRKIHDEELTYQPIHEIGLYGVHPQELIDNYPTDGDQAWYFFTSRNRKYPKGKRPSRSAKEGFWKATGADTPVVREQNHEIIGLRKSLVFYVGKQGKDNSTKTPLMMHEYRIPDVELAPSGTDPMKLDNWVLCKIYYNRSDERSSTKKNSRPRQTRAKRRRKNVVKNYSMNVRQQPPNSNPSPLSLQYPTLDHTVYAPDPQFNHGIANQPFDAQIPCHGNFTQTQVAYTLTQSMPPYQPSSFGYNHHPNPIKQSAMQFPDRYSNHFDNMTLMDVSPSNTSFESLYLNDQLMSFEGDCPGEFYSLSGDHQDDYMYFSEAQDSHQPSKRLKTPTNLAIQ